VHSPNVQFRLKQNKLNKTGDVSSWMVKSPTLPEAFRLTRTEGGCLAILVAAARKKKRPYVAFKGFRYPSPTYSAHKCGNPQRSLCSLTQKLLKLSARVIEHSGRKGYRIWPHIEVRLSVSRQSDPPHVKTFSLRCVVP